MPGMADSPVDVPLEDLVEAERLARQVLERRREQRSGVPRVVSPEDLYRAGQVAQDLVDRVARGEPLPKARQLTSDEARAIDGPPYDEA